MKKRFLTILLITICILCIGCTNNTDLYNIVATALPVYDFTTELCRGTDLTVGRLVTENISCLHDYSLQVKHMQMIESADLIVISGAGLEDFLDDALTVSSAVVDASSNTHVHSHSNQVENHDHATHTHVHEQDPHIWLSPENAMIMAENICSGLEDTYPEYANIFRNNLDTLMTELQNMEEYGNTQLAELSNRNLITFHDGFAYLAESFDLTILESIEEESGSEASAAEIIHLIDLVKDYDLPAIFTEKSGSSACAGIIADETNADVYTLDMGMSGDSYFDAMYHNINTLKEALN